ncbi:MAG TPA: hypothetical protein VGH52_03790 [Gaiellaceae bacterium]|jgi:hypothetical protein
MTSVLDNHIDDLLLQARGLELVHNLLAERGASRDELQAFEHELDRIRRELRLAI